MADIQIDKDKLVKEYPVEEMVEGQEHIKKEKQRTAEMLDFNHPDYTFTPKETHNWKQRGYWLVCDSCDLEHGTWIGRNKIMTGITDEGLPIVKSRTELNFA